MISPEDARAYVLSLCRPLPAKELPLADAVGLVLVGSVAAPEPVPPFANSSMDGYALRASDITSLPARLRVVGDLMAGTDPAGVHVGPGEAVRIMTGAALPAGADAVCMVERARVDGDGWVVVGEAVPPGGNVRSVGDDIQAGQELFSGGEALSAGHIGVLASVGVQTVRVHPRPRAGVISTGDELVTGPGPLAPGKIRDSNRPALLAALAEDGFEAVDLGTVADEVGALAGALENAVSRCDAVLTSGGVSVGDRDLVKVVLGKLGGEQARWLQVAVKPAKPFAFSTLGPRGAPVFGLPGNPVSALVSYELFARPALRLMAGHRRLERPLLRARAAEDLRRPVDGKLHSLRVAISVGPDGELEVAKTGGQGSHQLLPLARANALALLPDGPGVSAGEQVDVWLLRPCSLSRRS